MRNIIDSLRVMFLFPPLLFHSRFIRLLVRRFDKRVTRYLHFTWDGENTIEQVYPVAGPWSIKTARRHGRKWIAKAVKLQTDGLWNYGDYRGQWYFSAYSAPYWASVEKPGYRKLIG